MNMTDQAKSREELIKELKALRKEHDALKASFEKDLAERDQAENTLRENERLLRESQEVARLGSYVWTSQTVYGQVQKFWMIFLA